MQPELIQSMREQVRAIHRAFTGEDVVEDEPTDGSEPESADVIARRFAELEVIASAFPSVMERVPPYMFTPPIDVVATDGAVLLEMALPGIARGDITIEPQPGALVISGIR